MKNFVCILLGFAMLTGCAARYQKDSTWSLRGGYSDFRVKEDQFVVRYRTNEFTDEQLAYKLTLMRASVLTVENGFRYFHIVSKKDLTQEVKRSKTERAKASEKLDETIDFLRTFSEKEEKEQTDTSQWTTKSPEFMITIDCYRDKPIGLDVIDAQNFLMYNPVD
ncbi:MAG: hypothetical protein MRY21_05320 [Simkaniaceae bacterium]|nr:hypothetical protein [Simkaniaceae bacterium]